jgi:hypothetical protein
MDERVDGPAPFNWERLLLGLFVVGMTLWVLGGAASSILIAYSVDPASGSTASEAASQTVADAYKAFHTVETIAFKLWIACAVTLVLPWFRTGTRRGKSELPPSDLPLPP